jgi:serine/threonine-protein kinase
VLLLAAALVAFALLTGSDKSNVPTVIGQPLSEARATLERKGFDVSVAKLESCKQKDTVIEQDPPAGTEADDGSTVTLTVSLGQSVRVPNVVGQPVADATKELEDKQLLASPQDRASAKKPGTVVGTDPPPTEEVPCQSKVTLFVSTGPNLVEVPSLIGSQQESAEAELRDLKLIPNVDTRNADEPEGTVIDQSPGAGESVKRGETVTIVVSSGAGSVIVPNVEGQPRETAVGRLQDLGISVDVVDQDTELESEDGRVLDQAPASGTRIRRGDTVTIFVGNFVPPETTTTTSTTTSSTTTSTSTTTTPKR